MSKFKAADLVFCGVPEGEPSLILPLQQMPGEEPSYANHVGGFVDGENVVEALLKVRHHHISFVKPPYQVWRYMPATDLVREYIAEEALSYVGNVYGWWKLLAHAGDWALTWGLHMLTKGWWTKELFMIRRLFFLDKRPICSWVWAQAYARAINYSFGTADPRWTTPDQMHDHVINSDHWEMVHNEKGI